MPEISIFTSKINRTVCEADEVESSGYVWILIVLLGLSYGLGRRLSRGFLTVPSLEAAMLIWPALFLACTYYQVGLASLERTTLIHEEADSIAQVYRILQTLPQAQRAQMRLLLVSYLDAKLRPPTMTAADKDTLKQELMGLQTQLYTLSCQLTEQKALTASQGQTLSQALNGMISLHYRCTYAQDEHLPGPVVGLLMILCALVSLLLGLGDRNKILTGVCTLAMLAAFAVVLDMDNGDSGFIRVDKSNLRDLRNILHQQEQL